MLVLPVVNGIVGVVVVDVVVSVFSRVLAAACVHHSCQTSFHGTGGAPALLRAHGRQIMIYTHVPTDGCRGGGSGAVVSANNGSAGI